MAFRLRLLIAVGEHPVLRFEHHLRIILLLETLKRANLVRLHPQLILMLLKHCCCLFDFGPMVATAVRVLLLVGAIYIDYIFFIKLISCCLGWRSYHDLLLSLSVHMLGGNQTI